MKLIMLPGMDGTGILLRPLEERLAPHLEIQTILLPPEPERNTYDALVAHMAGRMPGDEPFVLLAESFSGPLGVQLAARAPNCRALILAASFLRRPVRIIPPALSRIAQPPFFRPRGRLLGRMFLNSWRTPSPCVAELLNEVQRNVGPHSLCARARAALTVDARDTFRQLRLPVLAFFATRDMVVDSRRAASDISSLCPHARIHWFNGSHLVLQNNTDECARLVQELIDGLA